MNEDILRDHLETPFHDGIHPAATVVRTKRNPTCGDEVTLSLVIGKRPGNPFRFAVVSRQHRRRGEDQG